MLRVAIFCTVGIGLIVTLLHGVHAAESASYLQERSAILAGVNEVAIDPGAVAGPLCVVGERAFPVLLGRKGNGLQPVVAAGYWGAGRVVAFGHTAAFWTDKALADWQTRRFLLNCLRWAGGPATPLNVAVYRMPSLATQLRNAPEFRYQQVRVMDWNYLNPNFFPQTHVLIVNSHDLSPQTISLVSGFVRQGGGLLVSGLGWGWLQLNPGKNLKHDFPGNALLAEPGIFWADGYLERTARKGFTNLGVPGREYHALEAARLLAADSGKRNSLPSSLIEQASQTVALALSVIPDDHPLKERIALSGSAVQAVVPTPQSPVRKSDTVARATLRLQVLEALQADREGVAHPAAAVFPGSVPPGSPRVSRSVTLDPTTPGWQSTGLYAVAGEPITVELDVPAAVGGVFVQIGCHTDRLWHLDEWKRVPEIVKRTTISSPRIRVVSPFGGLVYLGMVRPNPQLGQVTCRIDGAIEAPVYFHGQTSLQDWRRIRLRPAPWAELVSRRIILTLPSEYVRDLDEPDRVMDFWTAVIEACDRLAGGPPRPDAQRIVCDVQISAGYMHSGYPIMTHLDIAPVLVNVDRLRANGHGGVWGLFHEIGHNYQSADWTFQGTGEVTNNLFTVYVFDHLCHIPREKTHPALEQHVRLRRRQAYFAAGAPFERWQADPFLALDMYLMMQEAFGWEPFQKTFAEYRTLRQDERPRTDQEKRDQWLVRFSRAVGRDLSGFFQMWGIPVSPQAVQSLRDLPPWQPPM
ncbi:MAG: hypothetical protein H5U08_00120 [Thermogutta sp.]|uniref:M60 family metallopeptidase n=1 Tax=Thermogutta sp. TaxID=1962930 RepID=UPI0019968CE3|nr:M60 family metallopeptidase [Thermogutta sp.]MBC7350739.1 hypothetical protein [Thermogutta sp.]